MLPIRQHLSDSPLLTGQRIHEDPHMTRGGCTVEAAGSQIDATLETRWRRIAERLGNDTAWLVTDDDSNDGRNLWATACHEHHGHRCRHGGEYRHEYWHRYWYAAPPSICLACLP